MHLETICLTPIEPGVRASSLSVTTYFFTAACFAVTMHLRRCGAIDSEIRIKINDVGLKELPALLPSCLDLAGTAACATSGTLLATRARQTPPPLAFPAVVAGIGGNTPRRKPLAGPSYCAAGGRPDMNFTRYGFHTAA